ncbi:MAG: SUMF1/EgtB/PvdO family nonheme iron enzyme [Bacteroidota bacterium]
MYVRSSLLFAALLFVTASSLSVHCVAQDNPAYHKSRTRPVIPYKHATLAAPPGMVYIPGGSVTIKYSQSSTDTNSKKKVSLSSFYIDKTEVTNQQYRMFTDWIVDSIAVVQYLKDDIYFLDQYPDKDKDKEKKDKDAVAATTDMPATTTTTDSLGNVIVKPVDSISSGVVATPGITTGTIATPTAGVIIPTDSLKKRRINWAKVSHKAIFESDDEEIKAKIRPMLDPITGKVKKDLYVFPFTYLKATGTNVGVKIGEYATENINIYPDEQIWFKDINNSQVEILVENYFTQPPYDDYPVVGVTWKQARAFAYWRSLTNADFAYVADYLKYYRLQYTLPSEAQWVYAAGKDMKSLAEAQKEEDMLAMQDSIENAAIANSTDSAATGTVAGGTVAPTDSAAIVAAAPTDSVAASIPVASVDEPADGAGKEKTKKKKNKTKTKIKDNEDEAPIAKNEKKSVEHDRDGTLLVNFKQGEGDYTEDGANFTLPVMSYAPNEFGVYNMVGNVSEWVLDAYSPSTFAFVSDVNPVLLYDADSADADAMKRKVVRGGSFISNAKALSPFSRDFELQNTAHCFIGFRCVMSAPDILNRAVSTRRKNTVTEKKAR